MRTDSIFYYIFSQFPGAFFTIIGSDERQAEKYTFKSVEVKELAFRFDGIFLPKTYDDFIYFTEVQFKNEADFYLRFFGEIAVFLRQYRPKSLWRAVVLFPDKSCDPGIEPHYKEFFESGRIKCVYLEQILDRYPEQFPLNLLKIVLDSEKDVPATLENIARRLPQKVQDTEVREKIIELLISILMSKFPTFSREEIEKMIEPLLSDVKKSRAYQEYKAEIEQELGPKIRKELGPKIRKELTPELKKERSREIAQILLLKNMATEFIVEVTGLSAQEVLKLSQQLSRHKN